MGRTAAVKTTTLESGFDREDAEEKARVIRALIDDQQPDKARRAAAKAAADYPDHPWLVQADRVLSPSRKIKRPASGRGRSREFAWLRQNAAAHRGQWIAVQGDRLIASADTFQEVQRAVEEQDPGSRPLLHYIG